MTVCVVDAAAVVDLLCHYPAGEDVKATMRRVAEVIAPAHLDAEVFQAFARLQRAGELADIRPHLAVMAQLSIKRLPLPPLLAAAHQLLGRVAAKDALYVALARSVDGQLITTDERLERAVRRIVPVA